MSTTPETASPQVLPDWLAGAAMGVVAVILSVILWPGSFVVAGIFLVAVAALCRSLPRHVRLVLRIVGLVVAVTSALLLADFTAGTVAVEVR